MINAAHIFCLTCGSTRSWRNGDAQCFQLSNIADPFSDFFPFRKAPKPYLVSENCQYSLSLSLSLSLCVCSVSGFLCRLTSWKRELVSEPNLAGSRFSHYFIFIPLSDNRNQLNISMKTIYWEFSCIKIQYVGTEREKKCILINNKYILHVQKKSCPVLQKCKQVCVSKLFSAKKEK